MIKTCYYLPNDETTKERIDKIIDKIMCFVEKKIIELNYLEVTFLCRIEDIEYIEKELADLV